MKEYIVNSVKSDKAVLKPKKTYKGKKKKSQYILIEFYMKTLFLI